MPQLIDQAELPEHLKLCPAWELEGLEITRTVKFASFPGAIDFVTRVAELAEEAQHHPDIDIRYWKVTLRLSTHSKGGLTDLDFALARRIDQLID